jgi:predicted amidophosphoribosyltransferase
LTSAAITSPGVGDRAAPLLIPPRHGRAVCTHCFNFTRGYRCCYACASAHRDLHGVDPIAATVPISYSVGTEALHHLLADYKRSSGFVAERASRILASVLQRFLVEHEQCVAAAAQVDEFDVVTVVPSSDPGRDETQPLRRIVGELVDATRSRHVRLLRPTGRSAAPHKLDAGRFEALNRTEAARVLLIDDTWTTGASARSAAAALRAAGARAVAVVVIGRHVNREWHENDRRLQSLAGGFEWSRCPVCVGSEEVRRAA